MNTQTATALDFNFTDTRAIYPAFVPTNEPTNVSDVIRAVFGADVLTDSVTIIVPETIHSEPAPRSIILAHRDYVALELSKLFGGATSTFGLGQWARDDLGLIGERVCIVKSDCKLPSGIELLALLGKLKAIAETVRDNMHQEAVYLSIVANGTKFTTFI